MTKQNIIIGLAIIGFLILVMLIGEAIAPCHPADMAC